jgi:[acyl-carrier-protein] S-malonyltransferase
MSDSTSAMKLVFMFPGQSSLYPTMVEKLVDLRAENGKLLQAASDYLGRDLQAHYRSTNEAIFSRNQDIQIGVFLANHMFLQILQDAGVNADLSLGLSLGEYNHLLHIGAFDFATAVKLVEKRGIAYDNGPRGAMASIFPMELEELQEVVDQTKSFGILEIVNLNSPRQQVLSGERKALDEALRILEEEHYCNATIIEENVPMHCSTFKPAGESLGQALGDVEFTVPRLPYFPNRLGAITPNPDKDLFVDLLSTHVYHPVLWRKSIDHIVEQWPESVFVEVGPKSVLYNLLDRKWHKVRKFRSDSLEDTAAHLKQLADDLRGIQNPEQ